MRTLQHQLKQQGLTEHSLTDFIEQTRFLPLSPRSAADHTKLLNYIEQETASLPADQALLGSSDISLCLSMATYKLFERQVTAQTYGPLDFDASVSLDNHEILSSHGCQVTPPPPHH